MTEVTSELRVFMRHVRAAGICAPGTRNFFFRNDLDWRDFVKNGIPVKTLREIGDHNALKAAEEAEKEQASGR